jgi:hypothetical protein
MHKIQIRHLYSIFMFVLASMYSFFPLAATSSHTSANAYSVNVSSSFSINTSSYFLLPLKSKAVFICNNSLQRCNTMPAKKYNQLQQHTSPNSLSANTEKKPVTQAGEN